jgi:hypothetical protein
LAAHFEKTFYPTKQEKPPQLFGISEHLAVVFSGTPEGTRTPDLLIRR